MLYTKEQINQAIYEILNNFHLSPTGIPFINVDFNQELFQIAIGLVIGKGYIGNIAFLNNFPVIGNPQYHLDIMGVEPVPSISESG